MKVLTSWLRSYLPELPVSDAQLAEDLTLRGIAVDGVFDLVPRHGLGAGSLFEMDITTNRVDAMNHYGIAREAATIYSLGLRPLEVELPGVRSEQSLDPGLRSETWDTRVISDSRKGESWSTEASAGAFPVRVEEEARRLCGRFTARVLRGITIRPSDGVVAERFRLLEQKQISNAVDATNYMTQAIGQPTHVFDLDTLVGGIVVRRARAGERLRTLDGAERTLDADDLVIADEERALSIAGVMGGWDSMITAETRNVLVEAAWFDPATIRRSSKRHGLHTDASHRFERGADFEAAPVASAMVSRILLEGGGYVDGELADLVQPEAERRTTKRASVALSVGEVRRILGPTEAPEGITAEDVEGILRGLGCGLGGAAGGSRRGRQGQTQILSVAQDDIAMLRGEAVLHGEAVLSEEAVLRREAGGSEAASSHQAVLRSEAVLRDQAVMESKSVECGGEIVLGGETTERGSLDKRYAVTLPSWRLDLEREIDLIEEVARVYGYNRFRNRLPAFAGSVRQLPHAAAERSLRATLLACGLSEAVSSTFCSVTDAVMFAAQPGAGAAIENPLSEEAGMLRPSLVPGMLTMLSGNLHRDVEDVALFELGTVFGASGAGERANDRVDERPALALGLLGSLGGRSVDFYALKGVVEQVAGRFAARSHYYDRFPADLGLMPAWLHPGRSARLVIDGSTVGYFGQLHPEEAARRKLRAPVYLGELRVDRLYAQGLRQPAPRELSRFQAVRRDFSFLLPDTVAYAEIDEAVRALGLAELVSFEPRELLRAGDHAQVAMGQVSLLLGATFQSQERTLREEDLQGFAERLAAAVERVGGRLRG